MNEADSCPGFVKILSRLGCQNLVREVLIICFVLFCLFFLFVFVFVLSFLFGHKFLQNSPHNDIFFL